MTAADTAGGWLFPLGHYLGPFHPHRDAPVDHYQIRLGHETVQLLTEDELAVWLLAHGLPGDPPDRPWTRQAIEAAAREQGGADRATAVNRALAELLGYGVLAEVPDTTSTGVEFAGSYRFCSLLVGLGADPGQPDRSVIGLTGNPVVTVDELGFQVWQWAPLYPDLWAACQAFAEVDNTLSGAAMSAEAMLGLVLRRVHRLLAHGAGYLDVTR